LDARASLEHLERALDHLSLAVELAPGTALYELGLAFVLDTGAHLSAQVDSTPVWRSAAIQPSPELQREIATNIAVLGDPSAAVRLSAEGRLVEQLDAAVPLLNERRADSDALRQAAIARLLARAWREAAIRGYRRAHALTIDTDLEDGWIANAPGFFDALISVEAGRGYSRLVRDRGPKDDDELKHVESVEAALAELAKPEHQDYMVTPLLVPDASDATLDTLFDGASACFDLGGIGEQQRWPWPRESASFLVWDPECTGSITSGRQLFGSATWWMFFEDGYAALDALDADRDGWLTGAELEGLALWCDVDRDGVSDPGEVESLAARRIAALAARADGFDGISPMRSRGAALADGGELPTFDWIAAPVPDP
jgi:hypothetical protein